LIVAIFVSPFLGYGFRFGFFQHLFLWGQNLKNNPLPNIWTILVPSPLKFTVVVLVGLKKALMGSPSPLDFLRTPHIPTISFQVMDSVYSRIHDEPLKEAWEFWKRVFILGMNKYMPSRYAKKDWQIQQEYNLMYVAVTRSMFELVYVDVE
jgi:hypothetical protein